MALQDHVGILLSSSLDRPAKNKKKPLAEPRYYTRIALPPEAAGDLATAMAATAPGGNWQAMSHNIKNNAAQKTPYPGIPNDWLILKCDTKFPVPVYAENGAEIPVNADNSATIRSTFFSGQKVRVEGSPYTWNNDGEHGISWNLWGVLAVGGGERRPGSGGGGFQQYRNANTPAVGAFGSNSPANSAPAQGGNGFGQSAPSEPAAGDSAGPFGAGANSASGGGGNPFAQPSTGGGNPFGGG